MTKTMSPASSRTAILACLAAVLGMGLAGPGSAADIHKGRELYMTYCAGCHAPNGVGQMSGTPNFTQGGSLMKPDAALAETIRTGKNAMPGFRGLITDLQLLDVVAFLRTLR